MSKIRIQFGSQKTRVTSKSLQMHMSRLPSHEGLPPAACAQAEDPVDVSSP